MTRTVIFEEIRMNNSHLSFSSREPRHVIEIASKYSSKLTIPSLSLFKKSKRYSANCVWSPCGKSWTFLLKHSWLYKWRETIKEPWHLWRPLNIENSVFVYSNSMWRWRQRCQGSLIDSRYFGLKNMSIRVSDAEAFSLKNLGKMDFSPSLHLVLLAVSSSI